MGKLKKKKIVIEIKNKDNKWSGWNVGKFRNNETYGTTSNLSLLKEHINKTVIKVGLTASNL